MSADATRRLLEPPRSTKLFRVDRQLARMIGGAATLVGAFVVTPAAASAACAAAVVYPESDRTAPGTTLVVIGENWSAECNDACATSACSDGCTFEPNPPITDISISLVGADGDRIGLAEGIAAGSDLAFRVEVAVPDRTEPGRYRLVAAGAGIEGQPASVVKVVAGTP